jgi:Phosphatidylserine/phosphatidylglycerophosphate/cardiolipin synthases and related enzymes
MELFLKNWYQKFLDELPNTKKLKIISPFVKEQVLKNIQSKFDFSNFELITRYKLEDFAMKVSSLSGLKFSIESGANIYGIKDLHSKVYIFDHRAAIVTSANLTNGGLVNNYECGIFLTDKALIQNLHNYFDKLKKIAKKKLTIEECENWKEKLESVKIPKYKAIELPDYGKSEISFDKTRNYYIKFFGTGEDRVGLDFSVAEEVDRALCHYACCFPLKKKPRQVNDNDIIFMARMTAPSNYAIFGRAIALKYNEGRDEASKQEIAERPWKKQWPIYLRIKDPIFINGTMTDGILLFDLLDKFNHNSFMSTKINFETGKGNVNPRKSLMQKPYIRLTHTSAEWLEQKFSEAVKNVGQIDEAFIQNLPQTKVNITTQKK